MSKIRMLDGAEIHALEGYAVIYLRETLDGMLLIEIEDHQDRVQIGMRNQAGISYRFAKDLLNLESEARSRSEK